MRFSKEEILLMKSDYKELGCPKMAKKLGRTEKSVYACAHRLGLRSTRAAKILHRGKSLSKIAAMLEDFKMNPNKSRKELSDTHGIKIHSVDIYKCYLFKYMGDNPHVVVLKSQV